MPVLTATALVNTLAAQAAPQPAVDSFREEMVLILADEFDGDALNEDLWRSQEYGESGIKNDTLRGPDNVEVRDGRLLLHVRKEQREHAGKTANWTAGFVYTREPIENNVYIEARIRPGRASGVNNAFWLACVGMPRHTYRNRYEIDIVETRKDATHGDNVGRAHLAWHDWKGYGYVFDDKGNRNHVAQGIHLEHTWNEFHVWGLWLGENEFIYYLDGQEVWRGTTHPRYHDQWRTGVGKFDRWFPDEEQRAYGRFGQDDWSYAGGYNGDRMNVVFSNIPWHAEWSPLSDEADGDLLAVDYFRVFKPRRLLNTTPQQHVDLAQSPGVVQTIGEAVRMSDEHLVLAGDGEARFELNPQRALDADHPWYFSLELTKESGGAVEVSLEAEDGAALVTVGVDEANQLLAGFRQLASTATAYPANQRSEPFIEDDRPYLLVGRLTPAKGDGKAAISLCAFPLPLRDAAEPYYYHNIDAHGNTSATHGWHINQKDRAGGEAQTVSISQRGDGEIRLGAFRSGTSFASVLPTGPAR